MPPVKSPSHVIQAEQLQEEADVLADQLIAVLRPQINHTTAVLQALIQVHRKCADQLPPDTRACVFAILADYAIEQTYLAVPHTH